MTESEKLFAEACRLMPGGVNSPVRSFAGVGGTPRFIRSAAGCRLNDVDGPTLIDYVGSWGPMILGHAAPPVVEALGAAAARGTSYGLATSSEVELAREIAERVPSVNKVRMVNSGTEAVLSVLRLARAATERTKIIKFAGCYHGHADAMLVRAGSGVATLGLPNSPGVPADLARHTMTAVYNDLNSVERLLSEHAPNVAAVLVEPVAGNMGVVPPDRRFLAGLRALTREYNVLLVFDEVMTGFRVHRGGAQALYDIRPDLATFGKVIGGGLPVGAYGGRGDLMALVAPEGPVYQAGTLSGNPLATAAGLATLRALDAAAYDRLEGVSSRLANGITAALETASLRGCVQRVGSMLTVFFGVDRVRNYAEAQSADHGRFGRFFHAMLECGVHLPPSGYEAWFVSTAHDEAAIDQTLEAVRASLAVI